MSAIAKDQAIARINEFCEGGNITVAAKEEAIAELTSLAQRNSSMSTDDLLRATKMDWIGKPGGRMIRHEGGCEIHSAGKHDFFWF